MNSKSKKILGGFTLGILLLAIPCSDTNTAFARARKRDKLQVKETITKFLSSVKFVKKVYNFDHDGDGHIDMSIYPLQTENPDLKTKYTTLAEAVSKKQLILRENPKLAAVRKEPPSSYSILAQYWGSSALYYPRGGQIGGGWQNRGFGRGGIMGGAYSGRRFYEGYGPTRRSYGSGFSRYYRFGSFGGISLGYGGSSKLGPTDTFGSKHDTDSLKSAKEIAVEVDALCFEKWRLIEESRRLGEPEYFSYAGMASPYVRRELALFPNQTKAHTAIENELRRLGVESRTKALADIFKDKRIKEVINYYIANSKEVLDKNKGISGMVVTSRNRILCADIYAAPDLFKKMFPQLIQSAALGAFQSRERSGEDVSKGDIEKFLTDLKQVDKLKKETSQSYRLCLPTLVGEAELYSDENQLKLVHIEAYPRS